MLREILSHACRYV